MCWDAIIPLIRQDGMVIKRIPIVFIGALHELRQIQIDRILFLVFLVFYY